MRFSVVSRFYQIPLCLCLITMITAPFAIGCDDEGRDDCLTFADPVMMHHALCPENNPRGTKCKWSEGSWDTNKDKCIDPEEAAAVTRFDPVSNPMDNCGTFESLDDFNLFPNLTTLGAHAMEWCNYSFKTLRLDNIQVVEDFALCWDFTLTDIVLPKATTIGNGAFRKIATLKTVSLPSATSFGRGVFAFSGSIQKLELTAPGRLSVTSATFDNPENVGYEEYTSIDYYLPFDTKLVELVLHSDKKKDGTGSPKVTDDTHWVGHTWHSITFVD